MVLFLLTAFVLAGLAVVLARLLRARPSLGGAFVLVVVLGLVYDNAVIGLGGTLGAGDVLEALSWPRYVVHAFATPLLIYAAFELARRAGAGWARTGAWHAAAILLTLAMIVYGVVLELLPVSLVPEVDAGLTSYVPAEPTGVPVPALVTAVALLAVGVALWVGQRWSLLALASALAMVGFGLGPAVGSDIVGQVAEVVLIVGLVLTERWAQGREAQRRGSQRPVAQARYGARTPS